MNLGTRCKKGDMARIARNTLGCACTERDIGRVIYCGLLLITPGHAVWLLRKTELCKHCGEPRDGYLDADLDPIRPPPLTDTTKADESKPVEVEHG